MGGKSRVALFTRYIINYVFMGQTSSIELYTASTNTRVCMVLKLIGISSFRCQGSGSH